jgi:phosphopantothenoylcysteine synthetase/decarboxylase
MKKTLLVTAGPVWVPIDRVRVITNVFTGNTGLSIALEAARRGFEVKLLLGPGRVEIPKELPGNLEIVPFKYYEELYNLMEENIRPGKMLALFHSAAVPDYVPVSVHDGKIKSGQSDFTLTFKPTVKIVDQVKIWDPNIFLVKFKLEVGLSLAELQAKAAASMAQSKADLIVANDLTNYQAHKAYIMSAGGNIIECDGNRGIAASLIDIVSKI